MKKINKIKIKLNGKFIKIQDKTTLLSLTKNLKVPINKVAIELNQTIITVSYTHLTLPTNREV